MIALTFPEFRQMKNTYFLKTCTDILAVKRVMIILIFEWTETRKKKDDKQKNTSFLGMRDQSPWYLVNGFQKCRRNYRSTNYQD